jgi:hypothetical protein
MASSILLRLFAGLALFLACAEALRFDLVSYPGHDKKGTRCIRNFVSKDTLVMVTATVDGNAGDGQQVNINVWTPSNPGSTNLY